MPFYEFQANAFDIARNAMILDTNVLVTAFHTSESEHEYAQYFLDEAPYQWLIPAAVVVETWGLLVGARKDWQGGYSFLTWLNTPGKATIILPQRGDFLQEQQVINALQLDCVDAIISNLANDISTKCGLRPSLAVATYDTKDYYKLKSYDSSLRINIYDMRSDALQDLD